jgi:tRNA A37 threonylcarbamoyladenosine dehydratase
MTAFPTDPEPAPEPVSALDRRFDRMARLVGESAMRRLMQAHVMVVGVGGVGSWAAECLARSGIGTISLVDFDDVCITNFNRQIPALDGSVGQPKARVMAERLRRINPAIDVQEVPRFYNAESSAEILSMPHDFLIDAIDSVGPKCHLIASCRERSLPLVSSTGSGGRMDPAPIRVVDLAETDVDPLARMLRKFLRRDYGFPSEGPFGVPAVYSNEFPTQPHPLAYDEGTGFRCVCTRGNNPYFNCDKRNVIMGTASFITGAFGMHCAAFAVRHLLAGLPPDPALSLPPTDTLNEE